MARGEKFIELSNYLREQNKQEITLTFTEIESILGDKLCNSAYKHRAYWHLSDTHTFPNSWIDEGYKLKVLDLDKQRVIFDREAYSDTMTNIDDGKNTKVKLMKNINSNPENISENIFKYYNETIKDENGRYKSWEHCHNYFIKHKHSVNEEIIDTMCLQLAFYLASWGMYRGSSFLLQKDYKVHYEVVEEILKDKYSKLYDIECEDLINDEIINLVFEASSSIKQIYIRKRVNIDNYKDVSDVLITKILMGTFGCVPAYDRFFVDGIKVSKVATGNFNKNSMLSLIKFYLKNRSKLESCRDTISNNGTIYPQMKLIDMYFWQIGYDRSEESQKEILEVE